MTVITPNNDWHLTEAAGDSPIEVLDPQNGDSFVLVRADTSMQDARPT